MISFLRGNIAAKNENNVVIDVGGVGFCVTMPQSDIAKIGNIGHTATVNTFLQVREDQMELYGFITKDELTSFNRLTSVSGIGPKAAVSILGTLSPQELALCVMCGDAKAISRAPGVGTKIAQRVILELKDKFAVQDVSAQGETNTVVSKETLRSDTEAVNALIALGASPSEAQKTIMQMDTASLTTEEIIKEALRRMSNGI